VQFELGHLNRLDDAIGNAFDQDELEVLLSRRLNQRFENIVSATKNATFRNRKLVEFYNRAQQIERLVAAVRDARPSVPEFTELAEAAGLLTLPPHEALQVLVRPTQGGKIGDDPASFRRKLAARENSLCRIRIGGNRHGTGILIGEALVLTNFHVVEKAIDGDALRDVVCQFDFRETEAGEINPPTSIAAVRVAAWSPYSPDDLKAEPVTQSADFLDYAILDLSGKVASKPIVDGGELRGHTSVSHLAPAPGDCQGILILQHPNAQPMRVDLGAVTWRNNVRVRHTANTLGGSSGAPIFDAELTLIALHHAGYEWPNLDPPINQAVPISLIVADARAKGVAL